MFLLVLISILFLSIILSLWSLKNLNAKKELEDVKNKLKKGRVIFLSADRQDQSSGSSSSE